MEGGGDACISQVGICGQQCIDRAVACIVFTEDDGGSRRLPQLVTVGLVGEKGDALCVGIGERRYPAYAGIRIANQLTTECYGQLAQTSGQ